MTLENLSGVFGLKLSGWSVPHLFTLSACSGQLYVFNTGYYFCQEKAARLT